MLRLENPVERASTLQLVRHRVELVRSLARVESIRRSDLGAACKEDLRRLLEAEHQAAQARVDRFDRENPEIADLFVFRRQTRKVPAAA